MRRKIKVVDRTDPRTLWHPWFAWRRVIIEGEEVWWETVQRRLVRTSPNLWTYALDEDT